MERVINLVDAVPYLRAYHQQKFVIKIGGQLLEDVKVRACIARDIAMLHRLNIQVVVVHGGGTQLDALTKRLGLATERVAGRRITTPEVLQAAKMLFRGELNLDLVAALSTQGECAVGISGCDGGLIQATRRQHAEVDFGEVGDIVGIDTQLIDAILSAHQIPVIAPLAMDRDGHVLNINADTVAAELSKALDASKLMLLTSAPGILEDPDDVSTLLHWTDCAQLSTLAQGDSFRDGMLPKITAIQNVLEAGVQRVHVIDGARDGGILEEVFTTDGCGTLVVREAQQMPSEPVSPTAVEPA